MKDAIGIVEVVGSANVIFLVDRMMKAANVRYVSKETIFGLGRVTVFIQGDLSSVTEAINIVEHCKECAIFATCVIANPHPETCKILSRSMLKQLNV